MKYICTHCGHVFDEEDAGITVESYGDIEGYSCRKRLMVCPECGSDEIDEAAVCERCGEYDSVEWMEDGICYPCQEKEKENAKIH